MNSNTSGQAGALTVMTPIQPGHEDALRGYLQGLHDHGSPLARSPRTHFARWVVVHDLVSDPQQPQPDSLNGPYLLFTSNFDGPVGSYLDELCAVLVPEAERIWSHCLGCPLPAAGSALKAYLCYHHVDTGFFFAAYPHATVARVLRSLQTRQQTIDFAVRAQAVDAVQLRRAFMEEFLG